MRQIAALEGVLNQAAMERVLFAGHLKNAAPEQQSDAFGVRFGGEGLGILRDLADILTGLRWQHLRTRTCGQGRYQGKTVVSTGSVVCLR